MKPPGNVKELMTSFEKLKELVTEPPVLRYYNPKKDIVLTVDASSKGLGACILQENQRIAYGSKALTDSQQINAKIEKETLAISFGCTKYHQYIFGLHVVVESDHKPWQKIFRQPTHTAPPRLQRPLLCMQKYDLEVIYKPGFTMNLAVTLRRSYLSKTKENLVPDIAANDIHMISYLTVWRIKESHNKGCRITVTLWHSIRGIARLESSG